MFGGNGSRPFITCYPRQKAEMSSHIDDWMYAKLAGLRSNVNENHVKNPHSGGFLCEKPSLILQLYLAGR